MPNPEGRPTKYRPEYCQRIIDHFSKPPFKQSVENFIGKDGRTWSKEVTIPNDPPFLIEFAQEIGVSYDTIYEWEKKHSEFAEALRVCKKLQEVFLVKNGFRGTSHAGFTALLLKSKHGYVEKDELKVKHQVEKLVILPPEGQEVIEDKSGKVIPIKEDEKNDPPSAQAL